jgi:hypothetical protein
MLPVLFGGPKLKIHHGSSGISHEEGIPIENQSPEQMNLRMQFCNRLDK